jgi:hypothetical protein
VQEDVEEAFWWFVDQNWKDSLNVASADFIGNRAGLEASLEARQIWYYCRIQCNLTRVLYGTENSIKRLDYLSFA